MAASCFGVSGRASGSALAAAVMARSCCSVGMTTEDCLETLDKVSDLATIGTAKADDPSCRTALDKRHVVKDLGLRRKSDHAKLFILEPGINPNQRSFPIELDGQGERYTVLRKVCSIFRRIELDTHALL